MRDTKYLLVHDTSVPILPENCAHLGLPEGTTFEQMRLGGAPYNGSIKQKDGVDKWVLPFFEDTNLVLKEDPEAYEVLSLSEITNYGFDVAEDII